MRLRVTHMLDAPGVLKGLALPAILLVLAGLGGCKHHDNPLRPEERGIETPSPDRDIEVVSRGAELASFPCVEQCHVDRESDASPRELTELHTDVVINHAGVMHFCDACHFIENVDEFQLIDGTRVPFDESDRLCGQCHGEMHRDWKRGIHGIQTGSWRTTTYRRTCTACHDPHAPLEGIHLIALPVPIDARGDEG